MIDLQITMITFKFPNGKNYKIKFTEYDKYLETVKSELLSSDRVPTEYHKIIENSTSLIDLRDKLEDKGVKVSIKVKL